MVPDTGEPMRPAPGTTGIYTNPFGDLITGASKLGAVPEFSFFEVPAESRALLFEVFPGAPSVTGGNTIVFKGNYTAENIGRTGVYYRTLQDEPIGDERPCAGRRHVAGGVLIANNCSTVIPGHHHRGLWLHRAAQRGEGPGRIRRLRQ